MEHKKFIDIDKVLQEKATKVYKWLPRFVINWLKKTLHENDINECMLALKDDEGIVFNTKVLTYMGAKVEAVNSHLIPKTGSVVIASNHPLGGLDGLALIKTVGDVRSASVKRVAAAVGEGAAAIQSLHAYLATV